MEYQIITDSCCDLTEQQMEDWQVLSVDLMVTCNGKTRPSFRDEASLKAFYADLRGGATATTAAVNPQMWRQVMEPVLKEGRDVLVLAFSSGLSGTCQAAEMAARELAEAYPRRKIRVVDTLCAALGQGLLVYYACRKRDEGLSLEALADWAEETKHHLCHWVTVDDLSHLKRGGRISAATAMVGTMLNVKPIIHMDAEGKLINVGKVRGRRAAMEFLARKLEELGAGFDNETVFLVHGDSPEDAETLARLLKDRCGVRQVVTGCLGPVIGAHTGPGVLAVFFLGKHR